MIIEEPDFKMTSVDDTGDFWDLELLYTVKPKGKPEREEFKEMGYGLKFSTCVRKITNYRLSRKKEIRGFREYVLDYIKELDEIKILLKPFKDEKEKQKVKIDRVENNEVSEM